MLGLQCGWSALDIAAWNGYTQLCALLLDAGADPDRPGVAAAGGVSPLCLAVQQGHVDVCERLLAAAASTRCTADIGGCRGVSPLHVAAHAGHAHLVRLLLRAGADVDARMTTGRGVGDVTPLHLAVERGHLDVVDALLDAGSNVDSGTSTSSLSESSTC